MSPCRRLARLPCTHLDGFVLLRASSPRARLLGLAGLRPGGLPPGTALLLERCRSVHTVGMRFALDLVWLDGDGAVVDVDLGVGPGRVRTRRRARSVAECPAGEGVALASTLCGSCRP